MNKSDTRVPTGAVMTMTFLRAILGATDRPVPQGFASIAGAVPDSMFFRFNAAS